MWCIPAQGNAHFVCQMEAVLEVYKRPQDPLHPVVCMDETSVQCIKEVRPPIVTEPGQSERYMQTVTTEIATWVKDRNQKTWPADWRFTTEDARIKLKRLYPKLTD